jgi:hypothetical protein
VVLYHLKSSWIFRGESIFGYLGNAWFLVLYYSNSLTEVFPRSAPKRIGSTRKPTQEQSMEASSPNRHWSTDTLGSKKLWGPSISTHLRKDIWTSDFNFNVFR